MNSNGKPWLGGLYHKFEKMYDDIDHSSQDTVKFARNQMQTVGENVKKLGSHVMFDLPFPSFLASKSNSAPPLGRKTRTKPKLSINVIDLEYPEDAETEHPDVGELRSPSSKAFSVTTGDLNSKLIDDHCSSENLEDDPNVENLSISNAADSMCSRNDSSESSSLSSSTVIGQEAENETGIQLPYSPEVSDSTHRSESSLPSTEIKDKMPSSSNAYELTHVEMDDVKSWSPCSFISKDQEDTDELFTRIPFQLTTDDPYPQSDLPKPADLYFDHAVDCAPKVSIMCQRKPANYVSIFSSNSTLEESLNLVEVSHSALIKTDTKTCEDYFDTSRNVISSCCIPPLDCPPSIQQPKSYFSVDDGASSCTSTLTSRITGQSNSSVGVVEDLPMEKVDLSDKVELINFSDEVDQIQISDKVDRIQMGVSVTNNINFSMSSRRGCFNPYKKMFQNPFATKKRLDKDYKLISVWYGDIDTELSEITQSKDTIVEHKGVADDTEWEIV